MLYDYMLCMINVALRKIYYVDYVKLSVSVIDRKRLESLSGRPCGDGDNYLYLNDMVVKVLT